MLDSDLNSADPHGKMRLVSTRYLSRSAFLTLSRDSNDPLAERACAALDPTDAELALVHFRGLDKKTYEVRLTRAEAGEGPKTVGLRRVVEALGRALTDAETMGFRGRDGTPFVVLLDGGQVAAITAIESA